MKKSELESLFEKSVTLIRRELTKLDAASKSSKELLPQEASKILTDYLRTLILLQKNERAESLEDNLKKMSDENLKALAHEATVFLLKQDERESA